MEYTQEIKDTILDFDPTAANRYFLFDADSGFRDYVLNKEKIIWLKLK